MRAFAAPAGLQRAGARTPFLWHDTILRVLTSTHAKLRIKNTLQGFAQQVMDIATMRPSAVKCHFWSLLYAVWIESIDASTNARIPLSINFK
jgi:hypothetical protein